MWGKGEPRMIANEWGTSTSALNISIYGQKIYKRKEKEGLLAPNMEFRIEINTEKKPSKEDDFHVSTESMA